MRNTGSLCSDIKFFGLILDKKVILQHKLSGLHINQDLRGFLRVQNRGFLRFFCLKNGEKISVWSQKNFGSNYTV